MGLFQDIFSTDKPSIYIHTSKPEYYPGELVEGTVHLNVTTPADIDSINLLAEGFERVKFTIRGNDHTPRPNGRTSTPGVDKICTAHRPVFIRTVNLLTTKSTLQPGVFVFPFQFTLNNNLPGTCTVGCGDSQGSVRYTLHVQAVVPGFFKANLEHLQDLRVIEPLRKKAVATQAHKEENVTFLCCIPKGSVSLSADLAKNVYYSGETVEVKLKVNNSESQVNLRGCSLELVQQVFMRSGKEEEAFGLKVVREKSLAVAAGEICDRTIQMILPADMEATTIGGIIRCTYELTIRLSVPWSPDVVITQPVDIVATPMPNYALIVPYIPNQVMMPEVVLAPMVPQQC